MSNDEQNNNESGEPTSPGIDSLDSILAKESAKAKDERDQITQALKAQEDQRRSDEKAELEARRNQLLAEREEAIRRRQSQIQQNFGAADPAAPVDAETQRMIPGDNVDLPSSKRKWMIMAVLVLAAGGSAFGVMGGGHEHLLGPAETQDGSKAQGQSNGEASPVVLVTSDVKDSDAKEASDAQTAASDAGKTTDTQSAAKDAQSKDTKVVAKPKPKPRVVKRPKPRRTKAKPKAKTGGNGGGLIKLRQGLGGR